MIERRNNRNEVSNINGEDMIGDESIRRGMLWDKIWE